MFGFGSNGDKDDEEQVPEQIEATFGGIGVYVSGSDPDRVEERFEDVWEEMLDEHERARERQDDDDDTEIGNGPSKTFG